MTDDRIAEIHRRFAADEGGDGFELDMLNLVDELDSEVSRLREQLDRWESGERRKSWPVIEAVPDGLHYAAELVRAQGTEGGDDHDALLRAASLRLKRLHDVAGPLLAKRDDLFAENVGLREQVASYENMINWYTTCSNCAAVLDSSYEETMRREVAEATIARVRDYCTPLVAADHVGRYNYGPILAILDAAVVGGEATPTETPETNEDGDQRPGRQPHVPQWRRDYPHESEYCAVDGCYNRFSEPVHIDPPAVPVPAETPTAEYPCPDCGYEGPHDAFSPNEAECGSCHCEFSYSAFPGGHRIDDEGDQR